MGEDGDKEVFLSLEDDGPAPSVVPEPAVVAQPEPEGVVEEEVLIPEMADTTFVQDASGSFTVSWPCSAWIVPIVQARPWALWAT